MNRNQTTDLSTGDVAGLPEWMQKLRQAAIGRIRQKDIEEIIGKQVEMAKAGNKAAVDFVFKFALGGDAFKGATFIQNNNYDGAGGEPTRARPGTKSKLDAMRRRAEAGQPLCRADDGPDPDLA